MKRILIDTSAYSAFKRGHPKAKLAIQEAEEIFMNPIILGELLAGFFQGKHCAKNTQELHEFLASVRLHTLPIDEETAQRYAVILNVLRSKGRPVPTNDLWIAATAMQHGLQLVTADAHFQAVEQIIALHISGTGGGEG